MAFLSSLIKIGRPVNILITLATVIAASFLLITIPSLPMVLIAAAGAALIAGFGNTINDVFDREIDAVNKPSRPIPSGRMSVKEAIIAAIIYLGLGFTAASIVSTICFVIALIAALLLAFYAAAGKRLLVIANLLVSGISALAFIYPAGIDSDWDFDQIRLAVTGAVFAFLFHFGREIIKDIEDMEGDAKGRSVSLPLVLGVGASRLITVASFCLLAIAMICAYLHFDLSIYFLASAVCLTIAPIIVVSLLLLHSTRREEYRQLQNILKILMPFGLMVLLIGRWTV